VLGGFGRKLNADLVREYRDGWNSRVQTRRAEADRLAAEYGLRSTHSSSTSQDLTEAESYIDSLPDVLHNYYKQAQPEWDSGASSRMNQASYDVISGLERMLIQLASWYPNQHFSDTATEEYISSLIAQKFQWYGAIHEPEGHGTGGTIVNQLVAGSVMGELKRCVREMALGLIDDFGDYDIGRWIRQWDSIG